MSATVIAVVICVIFVGVSTYINQRRLEKAEYRYYELSETTDTLSYLAHELSIDYFTALDILSDYMSPEEIDTEYKLRRKQIAKEYYKDTEAYMEKMQNKYNK